METKQRQDNGVVGADGRGQAADSRGRGYVLEALQFALEYAQEVGAGGMVEEIQEAIARAQKLQFWLVNIDDTPDVPLGPYESETDAMVAARGFVANGRFDLETDRQFLLTIQSDGTPRLSAIDQADIRVAHYEFIPVGFSDGTTITHAYVDMTEDWNGFLLPWAPVESVREIIAIMEAEENKEERDSGGFYSIDDTDPAKPVVKFHEPDGGEVYALKSIEIPVNGQPLRVWQIGCGFTWTDCRD